jgi:hypothetical protein
VRLFPRVVVAPDRIIAVRPKIVSELI